MGRAEAASRPSRHEEVSANMARMSNDYLQPSEDEVADQVMADAEGGVESSILDAPEDEPDSAEPD
jgi:hypothetical protein